MIEVPHGSVVAMIIVSAVVLSSVIGRRWTEAIGLPIFVAQILLGVLIGAALASETAMNREIRSIVAFLGEIGIITLLFRVGMDCKLDSLLSKLGDAAAIWIGNAGVAGVSGFVSVYLLFGQALIPALFGGAALSATSIGLSTTAWKTHGALESDAGALLIDVAELDDISAVMIMSLVLALAHRLRAGSLDGVGWFLLTDALRLLALLIVLMGVCYVFGRYLELHLREWFKRQDQQIGPPMFAIGTALLIASVAALLGLSLAVGALFAGLAFSRDPTHREIDCSFAEIDALFSPFFFVAIGLSVGGGVATAMTGATFLLLTVAVAGKLLGAGVPAAAICGWGPATLIAVSMIPRAEISLMIMSQGKRLGDWAVPQELFDAMVVVCLATAVLGPFLAARLLVRNPHLHCRKDRP